MDSRELRIGNYVDCNGIVSEIVETRTNYVRLKYFREDVEKEHISLVLLDERVKEIPLTEEWLLKFGFEKIESDYRIQIQKDDSQGNSDYWIYVDSGIDNETNKFKVMLVSGEGDWFTTKNKYVHQLQNLYYALTGEELTFKNN